jgi:hypothetical protein
MITGRVRSNLRILSREDLARCTRESLEERVEPHRRSAFVRPREAAGDVKYCYSLMQTHAKLLEEAVEMMEEGMTRVDQSSGACRTAGGAPGSLHRLHT